MYAQQQDEVIGLVSAKAQRGWVNAWSRLSLPTHVRKLLTTTSRVDRDTLARVLVDVRHRERLAFVRAVRSDFRNVFDTAKGGSLSLYDVRNALATYFPGVFSKQQAAKLFWSVAEERPAVGGDDNADDVGAGWSEDLFVKVVRALSTRCC